MATASKCLLQYCLVMLSLVFVVPTSGARLAGGNMIKSQVFLSPKIEVEPGQVSNKVYPNMDFPKGHIAIKSFDAELVDEQGKSVPLYDTYLHHWVVVRYRQEIKNQSNVVTIPISGVCDPADGLVQYFGLGSETRKTLNDIPGPYGIEFGNPADIPEGFQEGWMLNVHAIDTRGAGNKVGCLECTCDLYSNISLPEPLPKNYSGGLRCCTDGSKCKVDPGFPGGKRTIFLKYTVKYVDWDASIVPVRVYILDITDIYTKANGSGGIKDHHQCLIEYDVPACPNSKGDGCIDSRTLKFAFPDGGSVIYGVGHQHVGGTSIALYGEGGREICTSTAIYGTGKEAGNEAGYVVGMSTCYPKPGSVKISKGEMVTLVSNYSNTPGHSGVMGLFYLLIAD